MPIPDILQQIVQTKKEELAAAQAAVPLAEQKARALAAPTPRNFFAALTKTPDHGGLVNIIAEIKKQSPSAGRLAPPPTSSPSPLSPTPSVFDPVAIAKIYHAAGADALSVLTDEKYFGGKLEYLQLVKNAVPLPILRKDFIIDPYQVYEAKAAGADAILLIAEILSDSMLIDLQILATELKLTTLVEVHELDSLLRVNSTMSFPHAAYYLLGINNRDLRTFKVDLTTTLRLAEFVDDKQKHILVSESGIKDKADVQRLAAAGIRSLLIGQTLMTSNDIPQTLANLKGTLRRA